MEPISISIVGHANVGKTSLIRTIARDSSFGEVANMPGTTRQTEGVRLRANGDIVIEFFDTPGLEDSIALLEFLETLTEPNERIDNFTKITRFLDGIEAKNRFEQEAKILRQLMQSDVGLYVIDVREPILPKYHDELELLSFCGKPLLPVLNFTENLDSKESLWRETLAKLGLHLIVRFDTISPPLDGEQKLFQSLILLLDSHKNQFNAWLDEIQRKQKFRREEGKKMIAETLINIASFEVWIDVLQNKDEEIEKLQQIARDEEKNCVSTLLELYRFDKNLAQLEKIPLLSARFESDLFSAEALSQMGIRLGKGAITGAMIGAGIDLAVGGLSLGMGTAIGAILGGLSKTVSHYGKTISNYLNKNTKLTINDAIVCLLSLRLQFVQFALENRTHAATNLLAFDLPDENLWKNGKLPEPLKIARAHPEWSKFNKKARLLDSKRKQTIYDCVKIIQFEPKN